MLLTRMSSWPNVLSISSITFRVPSGLLKSAAMKWVPFVAVFRLVSGRNDHRGTRFQQAVGNGFTRSFTAPGNQGNFARQFIFKCNVHNVVDLFRANFGRMTGADKYGLTNQIGINLSLLIGPVHLVIFVVCTNERHCPS